MFIRLPLKGRLRLRKPKGKWFWAEFVYERINTFCFYCGIVGHNDRFCKKLYDLPYKIPREKFAYGAWMKADSRRSSQLGGQYSKFRWRENSDGGG
ncbi:hypothetical protein MANES_12G065651v8 [Manihot esculenta]|uniref:Uncharacterized protein n=1 Tax=Manihot esculenta TaxID=3983 RepID=A0ACC8CT01_MANES|nr:hypothetical protein MANES_12G065651v8 [Manihot esculenta]